MLRQDSSMGTLVLHAHYWLPNKSQLHISHDRWLPSVWLGDWNWISTLNYLYNGHCRDLQLVCSFAIVCNSGWLISVKHLYYIFCCCPYYRGVRKASVDCTNNRLPRRLSFLPSILYRNLPLLHLRVFVITIYLLLFFCKINILYLLKMVKI